VIVLGSTGSIGVNTLAIAEKFGLNVDILVAGNNIKLLNRQIEVHRPSVVVISDNSDPSHVNHPRVLQGEEAILKVIEGSKSELVVNALVGFMGLRPTLKAIENGSLWPTKSHWSPAEPLSIPRRYSRSTANISGSGTCTIQIVLSSGCSSPPAAALSATGL